MTGTKKIKLSFIKNVLIASLIVLLISFYPLSRYATGTQIIAIISGYFISLINVIIGYLMILWAINKGTKSFMVIIFGGMLVRMILVFLFLVLLITFSNLDLTSLVSSVFFFYFLFMGLEIYFLMKKKPEKNFNLNLQTKQ